MKGSQVLLDLLIEPRRVNLTFSRIRCCITSLINML